ncbi:hypothetical protein ACJ73_02666 [Blastomyces percursus]|uniref:ABC-2 type transporter transmembrane domain-containing protein n=1 Tax=Blastomyces percursus TaxID=1658174 RepID=A0A1J9RBS4_9EURO|nr:hypothetical protein ACJ73_02666 [Blastomyces percursus]
MMRDVMTAAFGIAHTVNTCVGDDFVRGVSGGERKRVSIAEAALSGAGFQCWDNSTRGLDSANAITFCKTAAVAIYQAPQAAYEPFDRVIVLYEGCQIFFGKTTEAKAYFESLSFECPHRQTVLDFLISMTSPGARRPKPGFENRVPRSPDEFAARWRECQASSRSYLEAFLALAYVHMVEDWLNRYHVSRRRTPSRASRTSFTPSSCSLLCSIISTSMPMFLPQRSLYEVRERPSKSYQWTTFVLSNILVEAVWNTLMAVLIYFCWYYPVGTFSHFAITWVPNAEIGGVIASLLWVFCLVFCGVTIPKANFPSLWARMHPVSPATYLVGGVMAAALAGTTVTCSETELLQIPPPANMTGGEFLTSFADAARGVLLNPAEAVKACRYCIVATTDQFLARFDI